MLSIMRKPVERLAKDAGAKLFINVNKQMPVASGYIFDFSGRNNHLLMNNTSYGNTDDRYGIIFNGSDSYLSLDNVPDLSITGTGNFSANFIFAVLSGFGTGYLVCNNDSDFADARYGVAIISTGAIQVVSSGVVVLQSGAGVVTADKWHHLSIARDNGILYMYFDRVMIASAVSTTNMIPATKFRIGCRANGPSGNAAFLKCTISSLSVCVSAKSTRNNVTKLVNVLNRNYSRA